MRLLVITQDGDLLGALRQLIRWGHRVVVCNDKETARRVLRGNPFNLVLAEFKNYPLDELPPLGEPPPHLAVVLPSGKTPPDGIDLVLPSPVKQDALKQFIQQTIPIVEPQSHDQVSALRICDGDEELLSDIVEVFLGDVPNQFEKIKSGFEQSDFEILRRAAHSVKGASGNIAAEPLRLAAQEMEWAAKAERVAEIRAAFQQVQYEFHRLKKHLSELYPPA